MSDVDHPGSTARIDQMMETIRETARWHSSAFSNDQRLRRKVDRVLDASRRACSTGVRFASPGDPPVGGGRSLAPFADADLPIWNKDDPWRPHVPIVVFAWKPEDQWAVRIPLSINHILDMVIPPARCDWHGGTTGILRPSHLTVARGEFVVAFLVCARCREKLDRHHRGGLHWWPVLVDDAPSSGGFDPYVAQ